MWTDVSDWLIFEPLAEGGGGEVDGSLTRPARLIAAFQGEVLGGDGDGGNAFRHTFVLNLHLSLRQTCSHSCRSRLQLSFCLRLVGVSV